MTDEPVVADEPPRQPEYLSNLTLLKQVADNVDFDITADQVGNVMATFWTLSEGDPVGTIRRDPETGAIATRVEDSGMQLWHVIVPLTGEQYNDLQPRLPWPVLG